MSKAGILALGLAAILAACETPGFGAPEYCGPQASGECTNLQQAATSIDWIGDGTRPEIVDSQISSDRNDGFRLRTGLGFGPYDDTFEVYEHLVSRFDEGAGLVGIQSQSLNSGVYRETTYRAEEWLVTLSTSRNDKHNRVSVWVNIVDDDERAAQILGELIEAFGGLSPPP